MVMLAVQADQTMTAVQAVHMTLTAVQAAQSLHHLMYLPSVQPLKQDCVGISAG